MPPYIHCIPRSSLASCRALDFIDEFNRVAADPELGVSLEQLEKSFCAMELAAGPPTALDE